MPQSELPGDGLQTPAPTLRPRKPTRKAWYVPGHQLQRQAEEPVCRGGNVDVVLPAALQAVPQRRTRLQGEAEAIIGAGKLGRGGGGRHWSGQHLVERLSNVLEPGRRGVGARGRGLLAELRTV